MNATQKIIHQEHEENNENQAEFFKKTLITSKNARIRRINDKLEIALWNIEKHLKDFEDLGENQ